MNFPLNLEFKKIALAPQISVYDSNGSLMFYVKKKLFKLKEAVTVFADREKTQPLYQINADRIIDFSARYHFKDQKGMELGSIKRHGARSIWKARYDIADVNGMDILEIHEENPWVKVMDTIFSGIPFVGMLSGYVFHPVFLVSRPGGELVFKVTKKPAMFESSFAIEKQGELSEVEAVTAVLGILMMTLLERARG